MRKAWNSTKKCYPDDGVLVETKIHDQFGTRNQQRLIRQHGMWYIPDKTMYVYYEPTHWRYIV